MTLLRRPAVQLLLIGVITLLAYSNTFHVPFIFDDKSSIIDNPVIKDLGAFLDGAGYRYNPRRFIGYLTVALNYRFGGLDVTGYHIFNLAVHIVSAWMVYALVRLTLKTPFFAVSDSEFRVSGLPTQNSKLETRNLAPFLAALLFAVHPVQTQAVTYIIQRLASLSTMFYLAALVFYLKARLVFARSEELKTQNSLGPQSGSKLKTCIWFSLSLLSAGLAMKTKEIAFTLPLITVLYEVFFFKATARKRILFLLPVALTIIVIPLSMMHADKPLGELLSDLSEKTRVGTVISRKDYLLTQFSVITTYVRLLLLPVNQNLDYDYPVSDSLFAPRVFFSLLLLAALLGLAVWMYFSSSQCKMQNEKWKKQSEDQQHNFSFFTLHFSFFIPTSDAKRLMSFGVLWFFITLSVESSVIPIADVIYEHRLYLPSVGAFTVVAVLLSGILQRYPGLSSRIAVSALVLLLAAATWKRNLAWGDPLTLWSDVARKSPLKARPHLNLGSVLMKAGRTDEAIAEFRTTLKLKPDYGTAHANLGAAYNEKGLVDEAIEELRIALRINPDNADALNNVGTSFGMKGVTDYAMIYFRAALRLEPDNGRFHYNLATALREKGLIEEAEEEYRTAIRLNPALSAK